MRHLVTSLLLVTVVGCTTTPDWQPAQAPLMTRWAADVAPSEPHPEYPRPLMRRAEWRNLNGLWEYAVTPRDSQPASWAGRILVPYPIESALSGVRDTVGPAHTLWYRRAFEVPRGWRGQRVVLRFEAVDWEARVWVNGTEIGVHRGGYDPFAFDITSALVPGARQEVLVAVWDPTDAGTQARGKQVREPSGIFYTAVTGIWQTVWLEPVDETAIADYEVVTDVDRGTVAIRVDLDRSAGTPAPDAGGEAVAVTLLAGDDRVAEGTGAPGQWIELPVPAPRLWSPDDPFLYGLEIGLVRGNAVHDRVSGHVGMREIEIGRDERGVTRILLNGHFVFQSGPLDQGYFPDGLYAAATEEAMVSDLRVLKSMGFNMLRKHVKVEPRIYYAWCDRLGLLVWQDMPSASIPLAAEDADRATDPAASAQFEAELMRLIATHRNHPSIVMWVPFNEGWGQYDTRRIVDLVRAADSTRLVNQASGWYERGAGDVVDIHTYPDPRPPRPERERAAVLGEYGGLGFNTPGHMWRETGWGYALFTDREALTQRFEDFFTVLRRARDEGLSAAVYTQTSDIETENNGLLTYDREAVKIDTLAVALAQRGYLAPRARPVAPIFVDRTRVELDAPAGAEIRYVVGVPDPTGEGDVYRDPIELLETATITAWALWGDSVTSRVGSFTFTKVAPRRADTAVAVEPGLAVDYYEHDGSWRGLPDFGALAPRRSGTARSIDLTPAARRENVGLRFRGLIRVPVTGVYGFHLTSDDGSRLSVGGEVVADNDGVHGMVERSGYLALAAGFHPVELLFFQGQGGVGLELTVEGPGMPRRAVPAGWWHRARP